MVREVLACEGVITHAACFSICKKSTDEQGWNDMHIEGMSDVEYPSIGSCTRVIEMIATIVL
jgi:hypothetical protein